MHARKKTIAITAQFVLFLLDVGFYPPYVVQGGILSLLWLSFFFIVYDYKFLSRGFTDLREILHGGSATSQTGLLLFWV